MTTNPFRDAALAAANRGWFVFPLRSGRKTPASLRLRNLDGTPCTWPSYATTDTEQIRRWWAGQRTYNIAIATGPSNLHVIDIDGTGHDGKHLTALRSALSVLEPIPATLTVRSPHGLHLYFNVPPPSRLHCTVARLAPGVDSRGVGGYIVAAGSQTPHGAYQVVDPSPVAAMPSGLIERLVPAPPPDLPAPWPSSVGAYVAAVVTREASRVASAQRHTRNKSLFRAAFNLGRLVAGGNLPEHQARTALSAAASRHLGQHAFTKTELNRTLTNGLTYGARYPRELDTKPHDPPIR
ncbi:bifunctional DNA primase/polymerase [Nocardia brasiliensis]|uniref:bifunctional DNA primase/polymerase n=1 Tax=Nocardia brasiliensis TaxID=37326 RepID=UPI002453E70C|nr:bifunctional DNA primase/polymerase [Nocardia brasiliensis]